VATAKMARIVDVCDHQVAYTTTLGDIRSASNGVSGPLWSHRMAFKHHKGGVSRPKLAPKAPIDAPAEPKKANKRTDCALTKDALFIQ
jgi:hypothetical protein